MEWEGADGPGLFYCYSKLYRMSTVPRGCVGVSCGRARQHLLSTKGREERQRQHLLSAKGREEHLYWSTWGRENTFLVHIGLRRTLFGPLRTPFLIGEGHFLLPFLGRAGSLSMLTGEGTHKGCPYGWIICARGGEGTHKGCPYGWIICARGGEGTHKGCPYGWIMRART